jgi:hypothetical protein
MRKRAYPRSVFADTASLLENKTGGAYVRQNLSTHRRQRSIYTGGSTKHGTRTIGTIVSISIFRSGWPSTTMHLQYRTIQR